MKRILGLTLFVLVGALAQAATHSGLEPARFDSIIDGKRTGLYVLTNKQGFEACITNYGARLVSLMYQDKDVVLGFDNVGDYRRFRQNYGATVGRYVGRISKARFSLDGKDYLLQGYENGKHISHGGYPGFADRVWDVLGQTDSTLTLQYVSPDGENGFPGELRVKLTYRLTNNQGMYGDDLLDKFALELDYEAVTNKPTVLNLTNHSFFNLSGNPRQEITEELLFVNSSKIATYDESKNLNGAFLNVDGTPFDFRKQEKIGSRIDENHFQLKVTGGYDHSFVLKETDNEKQLAAQLYDSESGISMIVYTTEPALHIYSGNGLKGNTKGKGGVYYPRRSAICFETMHFSDSPNQAVFPSTVLRPGIIWHSHTTYVFGKIKVK